MQTAYYMCTVFRTFQLLQIVSRSLPFFCRFPGLRYVGSLLRGLFIYLSLFVPPLRLKWYHAIAVCIKNAFLADYEQLEAPGRELWPSGQERQAVAPASAAKVPAPQA